MKIIKESKVITEAPVDVDLHNAAIRYAKKINKPVVYGYSKRDYKFYPLTPRVYNGDDKDFRKKYKAQSIYVAYPDKSEVEIDGSGNKERKKIEVLPESKKINEAKSLEDKVADELEKVGLTAYAGGAYLGHMVQIETEEEKNKAQKVADKFGLETKEIPHKTYTDFYILIPEEEEKKPVKQKRKTRKKVKESLKRINEDVTITNSPYKDEIAKYFGYSGDFEFLDLVADILSSIDDFTDDEDIDYEIDNNLSYYSEAWKVFEHYCWTNINEDPKYYDDAYIPFVDDIFALCRIISNKETEEIEESCKKPVKESVLSEKGKQALKNRR